MPPSNLSKFCQTKISPDIAKCLRGAKTFPVDHRWANKMLTDGTGMEAPHCVSCRTCQWPAEKRRTPSNCCPFGLRPAGTPTGSWPRSRPRWPQLSPISRTLAYIQCGLKSTGISVCYFKTLSSRIAYYRALWWHLLRSITSDGISQNSKSRPVWLKNPLLVPLWWVFSTKLIPPPPGCAWYNRVHFQ